MTLASQFSLEEENFYKDIQDLVKKGCQNEKELSFFLERYMDLLARADLDDETFIINFTKAGLIIEASAKVYGTKVDNLWINLENVVESLKNKGQLNAGKKKPGFENEADFEGGQDDVLEEDKKKLPGAGRRRKKVGDALFSSDDFLEIDNVTGLSGKNMNETKINNESKIKLCEKVPNMFIKNKTKKKKIDVCLKRYLEDKDIIRLRDWIISPECLLIKEIYTKLPESMLPFTVTKEQDRTKEGYESDAYISDDNEMVENVETDLFHESLKFNSNFKDEKNNNEMEIALDNTLNQATANEHIPQSNLSQMVDKVTKELNVSKESDLAKFPNTRAERLTEDCLVDVDEVFWNPSKFHDVIPSKKMRAGKTNKPACQLCIDKKTHKKKEKKCIGDKKFDCLESYFTPHVQPLLSEAHFGILPDEELHYAYETEMKLIGQLKKIENHKNINKVHCTDEKYEEPINFLGFDGFENFLMTSPDSQNDEMPEKNLLNPLEDDDNFVEDHVAEQEYELPVPVTENDGRISILLQEKESLLQADDDLVTSELEYQKLVTEELKGHYAAKNSFAKNKELGVKISKWHEMIADKIKLSQKRGALNMKSLAGKIMNVFPPCPEGSNKPPVMTFHDLVKKQSLRDIPRYFFACLQLTNEGNLDISKSCSKSLATDCMVVTQLRKTRHSHGLNESCMKSPSKELNASRNSICEESKRKRSLSQSPSTLKMKSCGTQNMKKQKAVKSRKRTKNYNTVNISKRRRSSVCSVDSLFSE